jgi:hypothetical protein
MKKLTKSDIPEGYSYAAVDADGYAYGYENRPILYFKRWIYGGNSIHLGTDFDAIDWQNSLIEADNEKTD